MTMNQQMRHTVIYCFYYQINTCQQKINFYLFVFFFSSFKLNIYKHWTYRKQLWHLDPVRDVRLIWHH